MERGLPRRSNPASDVSAASYSLYSLLQVYSSYTLVVESRAAHFQTAALPQPSSESSRPVLGNPKRPYGAPAVLEEAGDPEEHCIRRGCGAVHIWGPHGGLPFAGGVNVQAGKAPSRASDRPDDPAKHVSLFLVRRFRELGSLLVSLPAPGGFKLVDPRWAFRRKLPISPPEL